MSKLELAAAAAEEEGKRALDSFIYALKSPESQRQYPNKLKIFFDFLGLSGDTLEEQIKAFINKSKNNGDNWIQNSIISFINHYKKRVVVDRNLSAGTLSNYFMVIKLFCEMNDNIIPAVTTSINWKRIARGLPPVKVRANDRAPTLKEIQKLVEYPDRRIKPIVYTMCSSGIRIGAWDYLRWKHIIPIENGNGIAKIIVYAGEREEHYSFITAEAYKALKDWMDFRASYGEEITGESLLMRDLWETSNIKYDAKKGLATNPKPWKSHSIERTLSRALLEQNLRQPLRNGDRRHEFKTAHGFRKFFKTYAEQVMKPLNVELLMNHDPGISECYWRPKEQEVLQEYMTAMKLLTINDDKSADLQNQVTELTQKSEEQNYIIKGKLAEKEKEMEEMQIKMKLLEENLEENTSTLFQLIARTAPNNHLMKVEPGGTGKAELRIYNNKKAYSEAVETIKQKGDWDSNQFSPIAGKKK